MALWLWWDSQPGPELASPLSDYVGMDRIDLSAVSVLERQTDPAQAELRRQRIIAQCMTDRGVEFVVNRDAIDTGLPEAGSDQPPTGSRAWAETYGFGITTMAFEQDQVGQHLVGYRDSSTPVSAPNSSSDSALGSAPRPTSAIGQQNRAIFDALDQEARSAYLDALTGDPRVPTNITDELFADRPGVGGCLGEIQARAAAENRFYAEFGNEIDRLRSDLATDPRIQEHDRTVGRCVTAKGISYSGPGELHQRWADELRAIEALLDGLAVADSGVRPHLPAEAKARLITIQTEEIELAVATYDCGGDPATTDALYTSVAHGLEEAFVERHRQRLDEFRTDLTG